MIGPAQKDDALISEHIVLTCRLNRLSAYRQLGKDHDGKGEYCSDCRGPLADHRVDCCGFHGFPGRVPGPSRKPSSDGGIIGSISIGNVYPLCSATPTTTPAPSYYYEIAVVITPSPSSDLPLTVPVSWILVDGCTLHGTFRISLNPGVYSLTLGSCYGVRAAVSLPYSPSCSGLPKTVIVESGTWTHVSISVITGIY